jgi:cobalt/nickel transport system permease protein
MHVPDGFLSPQVTVPTLAVAAPLWAYAARRHLGRDAVDRLPVVGALTALAFVVQSIMIPVPGGTSVHLVGVMLLALLYHPLLAFVCESLVLVVQALFFGAGGVTVLGVNALAMGLAGPVVGWLLWRLLRPLSERLALFTAGWLSMQVSTLGVVGALVLQHRLDPSYFPPPPAVVFAGMMIPSLTVAGVAEGLYTVFAFTVLERAGLTRQKGSP